ncbi:MAG: sugar phosphate isomerase/epimerase family protein [Cyclobacteriaceae bacterium]
MGITGLSLSSVLQNNLPSSDTEKKKRVELAIATITCDGFGDMNFEPAFAMIPNLPFKNVEFNCWYARNLTPTGIRSIRERCRQHDLHPICIQGSSFGAGGNIIKDVTHKLWNLDAARQLGCKRVKFTGAERGKEGGLQAVIEVLKEIAPAAEEMDILILVENHANNNLENIEDYDRVFNAVPSQNVGMCMDNAHFDGANVDLMEVVHRFHSRIFHIDLKETERKGIHKVVRFGEGVTDNTSVIEKMIDHGYSGYLLVEMAPPLDPQTLKADLTKAYDLFHKYEK